VKRIVWPEILPAHLFRAHWSLVVGPVPGAPICPPVAMPAGPHRVPGAASSATNEAKTLHAGAA
jgi:hypothetical protein